jgi:hypothetical protein
MSSLPPAPTPTPDPALVAAVAAAVAAQSTAKATAASDSAFNTVWTFLIAHGAQILGLAFIGFMVATKQMSTAEAGVSAAGLLGLSGLQVMKAKNQSANVANQQVIMDQNAAQLGVAPPKAAGS